MLIFDFLLNLVFGAFDLSFVGMLLTWAAMFDAFDLLFFGILRGLGLRCLVPSTCVLRHPVVAWA